MKKELLHFYLTFASMKKALVIFLTFQLLISGIGVLVFTHVCSGHSIKTSFFQKTNEADCCGDEEAKTGCCKDELKILKLNDDFKIATNLKLVLPAPLICFEIIESNSKPIADFSFPINFISSSAPPHLPCAIHIWVANFRC